VNARHYLATLFVRLGKLEDAIGELEEVVRQRPGWDEATEKLAQLRRQKQKGPD
jgi:hypothetical protein